MLLCLLFSSRIVFAQNTIADGDWTNTSIWDTGILPGSTDNVTVNNTVVIPVGDTVRIGNLTISPTGSLSVYGTLIVNGDMTMEFTGTQESEFFMGRYSTVIVNGNVTLSNKVVLTLSSYFIVTGDFTKSGSSNQGDLTIDGAHIYLLGNVSVPSGGATSTDPWANFTTCDGTYSGSTSTVGDNCDYGTAQDFANNINSIPSGVLNLIDCSVTTAPTWNGVYGIPHSQGMIQVGGSITLTAEAQSDPSWTYQPVYYHWRGPAGFSQTTDQATLTISSATLGMTGYYTCTAVNSIGCSITDSTYVLVTDCGLPNSGYFSKDNYTGNWEDPNSWGTSDAGFVVPPPSDPVSSQTITIHGNITINGNLTIGTSQQYLCDTLVVTGDFLATNPTLTIGPEGVLIVLGNYDGSTSNGIISNEGTIIFSGNFDNSGHKISNTGDIYVFDDTPILNGLTPSGTSSGDLPSSLQAFYCSLSGGNCGIGSTSAILSGDATINSGESANLSVRITGGTEPYTIVYTDGTSNYTVSNYISGDPITVSPGATTTYSLVDVVDANSNTGTGNAGSATITVQVDPPVFTTCSSDITVTADATNSSGECGAYVWYDVPVVTDNSGAFTGDLSGSGLTYIGMYNGHSYYYTNVKMTPAEAQTKAFEVGGHLATITSSGENDYLTLNTPWGKNLSTTSGTDYKYWIGLTDAETEGTWKWVTGEPFVYDKWYQGTLIGNQPNNLVNSNGVDQDWAELWNFTYWQWPSYHDFYGEWNDNYSDDSRRAIIEFEGPQFTMDSGQPSGSFFTVGTHTLSFSSTDIDGNVTTCSFQITVTETEPPTITAPSDITQSVDLGVCTAAVSVPDPTYSDNCSVASLTWEMTGATVDNSAGSGINSVGTYTFNKGTTTITWTVTDASGNSAQASMDVTVTDDQNPTITAPADVSVYFDPSSCVATGVSLGTPTTDDNCGVASVTNNAPVSFPEGTTTVTWTVTDNSGNTATATQKVTVTGFISSDDPSTEGTDSWIGHIYDGTNFQDYYGYTSEPQEFDEDFGGSTNCYDFDNSLGAGKASINTTTFSVHYQMHSTLNGIYLVDIGSDDGARLYVDGNAVYDHWSNRAYATDAGILFSVNGDNHLLLDFYENTGANRISFNNLRKVNNTLTSGNTQNVCINSTPAAIVGSDAFADSPISGNTSYTVAYQWQESTDGTNFTGISGATGKDYTPPATTAGKTYYQRVLTVSRTNPGMSTATVASSVSDVAEIIVNKVSLSAAITDESCPGSGNGVINLTATGGTPGYTYSWSTTDGSGLNTSSEDQTGLSPGTYNVMVTDGKGCAASGSYTVSTTPDITAPVIETLNDVLIGCVDDPGTGTYVVNNIGLPGTSYYDNCTSNANLIVEYRIVHNSVTLVDFGDDSDGDPSGYAFPEGISTVTFKVIDESLNETTQSFNVEIHFNPKTQDIEHQKIN
ncbi:hypothetical protein NT017_33330 [Prolixibacter sp. NT017]|nr:hypothetical protein NT017_33330 [Prolixibacter sp. NT017]